jgi:hypothetical protein
MMIYTKYDIATTTDQLHNSMCSTISQSLSSASSAIILYEAHVKYFLSVALSDSSIPTDTLTGGQHVP